MDGGPVSGTDASISIDGGTGGPPTQLVIAMDSDLMVPAEADSITLRIVDPSGAVRDQTIALVGFPVRARAEWSGGPLAPVSITASLSSGDTSVVVTDAVTGFVAGEIRVLSLFLVRSCVGVACGGMQTCQAGHCASTAVPGEDLPTYDGPLPVESDFEQ